MLIFVISVLGFVPFCFSCLAPHFRIQTTCLLILSSLNFRYILSSKLPVISYLTTLDKYSIFAQFFLVVLCAYHAVIGCNFFRKKGLHVAGSIDDVALITIAGLYALYHLAYIVYFLVKFFRNAKIGKSLTSPMALKQVEAERSEETTPFIETPVKFKEAKVEPSPISVKEKPKMKSKSQSGLSPSFTDINSDLFFNQKLKNIEVDASRPDSFGYNNASRHDMKSSLDTLNRSAHANNGSNTAGKNIQFQDNVEQQRTVNNPFNQATASYRRSAAN